MLRTALALGPGREVVVMDSMSQVEEADRGRVLVTGSNGGKESGRIAVLAGCACAVFNDAGVGKDAAGVAGLALMDEAAIPGAAVAHTSAEISDGMDTWENGVLSHVNAAASAAGLAVGMRVREAVARLLPGRDGDPDEDPGPDEDARPGGGTRRENNP